VIATHYLGEKETATNKKSQFLKVLKIITSLITLLKKFRFMKGLIKKKGIHKMNRKNIMKIINMKRKRSTALKMLT
jgi:hypothetical protein